MRLGRIGGVVSADPEVQRVRCSGVLVTYASMSVVVWAVVPVILGLLAGWLLVALSLPFALAGLVLSIRVIRTGVDVHPSSMTIRNVWRTCTIADEDIGSALIVPSSNWVVSAFCLNHRYSGPDRVRLVLRDGSRVDVFVLAITERWWDGDLVFHRGTIDQVCSRIGLNPARLQQS